MKKKLIILLVLLTTTLLFSDEYTESELIVRKLIGELNSLVERGSNSTLQATLKLPMENFHNNQLHFQIVEKIDRGELNIRFQHENLGGIRSTLENITNRLTLGIIIAALIIASSMIITTGVKPLLLGFPALGIIGYLVSGVLGLWLIFNIIRSRKF